MITAKQIMCKRSRIKSGSTGRNFVFKMMSTNCPGLPVVNDDGEVIGVVTANDILHAIKEGKKIDSIVVDDIMSSPVTIDPDTPLDRIVELMVSENLTIIPVVKGKKLVGIVGKMEVIDASLEPELYSV